MADRLELQRIASAFRMVGWGAFWSQLTLALVSAGVLAFNSIGSELVNNRDKAIGLCLLYTSPSPRDNPASRMPSSA